MANLATDAEVDMAKFRLPSFAPGTNMSRNTRIAGVPNFDGNIIGKSRMLIVALDYKNAKSLPAHFVAPAAGANQRPLSCTIDAKNVEELANGCCHTVTSMYNEKCTKENVLAAITKVGQSCERDDFFVFYFAGHGVQVKDLNGDEEDGLDEAFLLVDPAGQVSNETILLDDDFSDAMYNAIDPRTRILILTDCGLDVADLGGRKWTGRKAISIAGFLGQKDISWKAELDISHGIFTHAMLLGIDKIGQLELYSAKVHYNGIDKPSYSVGMAYNAALLEIAGVFASKQDLSIQCTADASADKMPWPLIPAPGYEAPLRQQALGNPSPVGDGPPPPDENGLCGLLPPCRCQAAHAMLGTSVAKISPLVLETANLKNVLGAAAPNYGEMVQGTDLLLKLQSLKATRSCHSDKCVLS